MNWKFFLFGKRCDICGDRHHRLRWWTPGPEFRYLKKGVDGAWVCKNCSVDD